MLLQFLDGEIFAARNTPMTVTDFKALIDAGQDSLENDLPPPDAFFYRAIHDNAAGDPTVLYGAYPDTDAVADTPLPDFISHDPGYQLRWEVSFDGQHLWFPIGTTTHEVYVTLADPTGQRLESMYDIAVRSAAGQDTLEGAIDATWQKFASMNVANAAGHSLGYYRNGPCDRAEDPNYMPGGSIERYITTARRLLAVGNGQCGAWVELFAGCLRMHGALPVQAVGMEPYRQGLPICELPALYFLVKNYTFVPPGGSPCPDYPFRFNHHCSPQPTAAWPQADVTDASGIPGQNSTDPPSMFAVHFAVYYNSQVFDPSYGVGPFSYTFAVPPLPGPNTVHAWVDAAVLGFVSTSQNLQKQQRLVARGRNPGDSDMRCGVASAP